MRNSALNLRFTKPQDFDRIDLLTCRVMSFRVARLMRRRQKGKEQGKDIVAQLLYLVLE